MEMQQLLMYLGALVAIHLAPGPDNILIASTALTQGVRAAFFSILGIATALLLHLAAAALGLAALVATHPLAFEVLRWVGTLYLLWLAVQSVRAAPPEAPVSPRGSAVALWRRGLFNNLLNPKAWVFCALLLPPFIQQEYGVINQYLLLGSILLLFNFFFLLLLAVLSGRLLRRFRSGQGRWSNYLMGSVFIGLAMRLMLVERST